MGCFFETPKQRNQCDNNNNNNSNNNNNNNNNNSNKNNKSKRKLCNIKEDFQQRPSENSVFLWQERHVSGNNNQQKNCSSSKERLTKRAKKSNVAQTRDNTIKHCDKVKETAACLEKERTKNEQSVRIETEKETETETETIAETHLVVDQEKSRNNSNHAKKHLKCTNCKSSLQHKRLDSNYCLSYSDHLHYCPCFRHTDNNNNNNKTQTNLAQIQYDLDSAIATNTATTGIIQSNKSCQQQQQQQQQAETKAAALKNNENNNNNNNKEQRKLNAALIKLNKLWETTTTTTKIQITSQEQEEPQQPQHYCHFQLVKPNKVRSSSTAQCQNYAQKQRPQRQLNMLHNNSKNNHNNNSNNSNWKFLNRTCNTFHGHNSYQQLLSSSLNFYVASSVILVLCYMTTSTSATAAATAAAVAAGTAGVAGVAPSTVTAESPPFIGSRISLEKHPM